ncbi:MAG: hypothetical protein IJ685_07910 [Selenomonadaceae bacterium]|nr:hypothetical protein [Selenomonadaceae bacterium]
MIEVWKTIEHFGDGHFLISNEGNIKKLRYEFRDSKGRFHRYANCAVKVHYGKTAQLLATFESVHIAAIFCNAEDSGNHIAEVCNGKRDYAFGYKWRYVEETVTTNK